MSFHRLRSRGRQAAGEKKMVGTKVGLWKGFRLPAITVGRAYIGAGVGKKRDFDHIYASLAGRLSARGDHRNQQVSERRKPAAMASRSEQNQR